ncbi:MAG: right-handed parallel beta-helix repeat-containing protein [Pseudomonadota bacterium]
MPLALVALPAAADRIDVYPRDANADCDEPFEKAANALKPGDELVVHDGVYTQSCARRISVKGTAENPIVIRAADGARPTLTRPDANRDTHNNIEIVDSAHLVIRGLRFFGGSIGVRFIGGQDIVFEHNEVSATDSSAVTMNSGNATRMTVRHNHIHHAGQGRNGPTTGEGLYIGCNRAKCVVSDSRFEHNHIHDLRATSDGGNDGIEIKPGSGGNLVQHNWIHDTTDGRAYPCILVYGGAAPNVVRHNRLERCGEAIQAVADALITDNIVIDASISGFASYPHVQVGAPRNLTVRNNRFVRHPVCAQLDWREATDVVFEDNTLLCEDSTAVAARGLNNAVINNNLYTGTNATPHDGLVRYEH